MKKVIWIDDNAISMKQVVFNVFPELWKANIKPEIILFGDDFHDELMYDNKVEKESLEYSIFDTFTTFLWNENLIDDIDESMEKLKLIKHDSYTTQDYENINLDVKIVKDKNYLIKTCQQIIDVWKSTDRITLDQIKELSNPESTKYSLNSLIKELLYENDQSSINNNSVILIDLCLLKGDYKKLIKKETKLPLLSAGLFYNLVKANIKVFLYTTYVSPTDAINNWIENYNSLFGNEGEEKIVIFDRNGIVCYSNNHNEEPVNTKRLTDYLG